MLWLPEDPPLVFLEILSDILMDVLTETCNRIWRTGEWPTPWTQSQIITLPKKDNLQSARTTELSASSVIRVNSC